MYISQFLVLLSLNQIFAATIPGPEIPPALYPFPGLSSGHMTYANGSGLAESVPFQYTGPPSANEQVTCNGEVYGTGLDQQSCLSAWQRFQWQDRRLFSFGQRGTDHSFQQTLPMRISSRESYLLPCVLFI